MFQSLGGRERGRQEKKSANKMTTNPSHSSSSSSSSSASSERKRPKIDQSPNWSHLPPELLSTIFSLLPSTTDCILFRSVCPSWRSASPRRLPFPYLLYPPPSRLDADGRHLCPYFDLAASTYHTADLPNLRAKQICGSTDGWLVLRTNGSRAPFRISLFNPLTLSQIPLPSLKFSAPPEKIVITSFNPDPFSAVAIMGCDLPLVFHSRGRKEWRPLPGSLSFQDAVSFNGGLYAVGVADDGFRKILVYSPFTVPDKAPVEVPILEQRPVRRGEHEEEKNYLVEFAGELYLVVRSFSCTPKHEKPVTVETVYFEVFKLDLSEKKKRPAALEVFTLGDAVFFLGVNTSFSLSAANLSRVMPFNEHIYFTDEGFNHLGEIVNQEEDLGEFDMGRGDTIRFRRNPELCNPVIPPAVFFLPSL